MPVITKLLLMGNESGHINLQGPRSFKGEECDGQTASNTGARELCSVGRVLY